MRLYDVSLPVQPGMPVWPGDPGVVLERESSIERGDDANVSRLSCGVHTGTHIDAPLHFVHAGAAVDELVLERLIGEALVVELPDENVIDAEALERAGIPPSTTRVLFKTRNSGLWSEPLGEFRSDYVAVNRSGAEWLVANGIEVVGNDYLSIAPWGETLEPHQVLLSAGVIVIEGLDMGLVSGGVYDLFCLPIKLVGSDGAPARVLLQSRE